MKYLQERKEPTTFLRQPWNHETLTFVPRYDPGERVVTVYVLDARGMLSDIRTHWAAKRADVEAQYHELSQRSTISNAQTH